MHQQIAPHGNYQCMYAYPDHDPEKDETIVKLVCGKCYTPDALTAALRRQEAAASAREADAANRLLREAV
jgi:hypothetical protein